jgi:hypothetical protein
MVRPMRCRLFFLIVAGFGLLLPAAQGQTGQPAPIHGGAPSVSPDGSKIAFLSDRGGATDLYVIATDGTGETRLTQTPEAEGQPDWSADGKEIRYTVFAGDSSRIFSVQPDGKNQRLIGTVPGRALRLSPDGRRILYWIGTWTAMRLFASDLDGGGARQLTDGSGVVWGARWSSDGKRIAFADKDAKGVLHVSVMNADGSGRRQVTHFADSDGRAQMPSWSPDGLKLAVQAGAKDQPAHIWIVDISTSAARKLAAHDQPYLDEVPAWFPDGKRIAFQSDRTSKMEVWVMNADGSAPRQVTKAPADAIDRVDHLVYATPDLELGIDTIEKVLGIRATPGGQHPGAGTRNALVALGPTSYLEIIGPDPAQPDPSGPRRFGIDGLKAPRLVAWAAREQDLESLAASAAKNAVALGPIGSGSRKRADGLLLSWRFTSPATVLGDGLVPFFIDWGRTPHPAQTAAAGATLVGLRGEHPDAERVRQMLRGVGLELAVTAAPAPALVATVDGPKGRVELR